MFGAFFCCVFRRINSLFLNSRAAFFIVNKNFFMAARSMKYPIIFVAYHVIVTRIMSLYDTKCIC
jgi:hypothetical protein